MNEDARRSVNEGLDYETIVLAGLKRSGWTDILEKPKVGNGVNLCPDFEATDRTGTRWWIEAKGGAGKVVHNDSTLKAIALGALLACEERRLPYLVVYERKPRVDSTAWLRLERAVKAGWITEVRETRTPTVEI